MRAAAKADPPSKICVFCQQGGKMTVSNPHSRLTLARFTTLSFQRQGKLSPRVASMAFVIASCLRQDFAMWAECDEARVTR
jgi:hypothetical protein